VIDRHDDFQTARVALADLVAVCDGFFSAEEACRGATVVGIHEVPDPFRKLLVHSEHMTTTLADWHGDDVALAVLREHIEASYYGRCILLTLGGTGRVVEFGIARMNLSSTSEAVRAEILAREQPLGDILIRHDVLRKIDPKWFIRFDASSPFLVHFGSPRCNEAYGRVGVIHVDGQRVIELLEIVTAVKIDR
jgi:hypothetical protein